MESWKKTLYICICISFLHMSAMSMLLPFLPLYIKELGVTDPRALSVWSGIIFGISFLFAGIFSPYWGTLGDKYGRKPIILRSTFGISLVALSMSLIANVYQLFFLRILHGILGGIVSPIIALASCDLPAEKTGQSLGKLQSAMIAGNIIGPLIGGALTDLMGYRNVLLVISFLTFSAGLLTMAFVKETKKCPKNAEFGVLQNINYVLGSKHLRMITFIQFMIQISFTIVQPILPLFIIAISGDRSPASMVGLVFGLTGVTTMLFTPYWGRMGDSKGQHRKVLSKSLLFASIVFAPQAIVTSVLQLIPIRMLFGFFTAGIAPSAQAIIVKNTSNHQRGGVLGITQSLNLLGAFLGPLIGGAFAAILGFRIPFLITAAMLFGTWFLSRNILSGSDKPQPLTEQD